ncbi:MAG: hypothetical protein R3F11_22675 [Verrucomicrobiales bacterium]
MWRALSVITALLCLGGAIFSYFLMEDLKKERAALSLAKDMLQKADTRKGEMIDAKEAAEKERTQFNNDADGKETEVSNAKAANDELGAEKTTVESNINSKKQQLAEWDDKLADVGNAKELKEQFQTETDKLNGLNERIANKTQVLAITNDKIAATNGVIADFRQTQRFRNAGQMDSGFRGNLRSVYGPWGFVVLSSGDRSGVVVNAKLDVMRGGSKVGEIIVTAVEPGSAVADIVRGSVAEGDQLRPGDSVRVAEGSVAKADAPAANANAPAAN